ncbi:apolipoprotein N-acyltransferase [Desertimonas flava]|uniref:apolipoprotein N-acyltransferase n=1 Tax=Desertimonas flava TaxID=2064846 RepID=UPI000E344E7B|nr:apolipoprotein N-acyltransferase [Desertimonas flava]
MIDPVRAPVLTEAGRAGSRFPAVTRYALAALGGLAAALSLPPWGWWPLSFVGVALLEVGLGPTPHRRARFGAGFTFGFVWLVIGTAWMWQLTAPGYVVANAVFGLYHGVAALAAPAGRWRLVGRPLAHTLVEALRLSFPFGGVPLATFGIAQAGGPFLTLARVGGVILITWFVFQVGIAAGAAGGAAAGSWRTADPVHDRWRAVPVPSLAAVALTLVVFVVSLVAPRGHGTGTFVDVAAVQGGGEQGTSAEEVPSRLVTERHLEATASIEPDDELDLVLWPENVVDVADFATSEAFVAVADQAARLGVPIALGVTEDIADRPDRFTNAQIVVTPAGDIVSRYDKVRRVPFGEYVPLRGLLEALGAPVDQIGRDALAGTDVAVLDIPLARGEPLRVAVVISWEVFFGGRVREGVKAGGGFVINPTNGASYTGTIVQTQQVASSRLRAVETGRWVVQAAPTGFSAFVSPGGDVIDRTAVSERAIIRHEVEVRSGRTWYVALGDWPFIVVLLAAFGAVRALSWRDRSRPSGSSALDHHGDRAVVHE